MQRPENYRSFSHSKPDAAYRKLIRGQAKFETGDDCRGRVEHCFGPASGYMCPPCADTHMAREMILEGEV